MILRRFEDSNGHDVDALLGSLSLGVRNKWLIGKDAANGFGKLNFALKYSVIEPGKLYPMLPAEHTEALFILAGNGLVSNEAEEIEVKEGDLILTGGGEMRSIKNSGRSDLKTLSCIDLLS